MSTVAEQRRRSARGDANKERILDAAAEVAGERGYEGTSINLVSKRSGLPASSIYWHFKDKDELIAAVIDRSFKGWQEALEQRPVLPENVTRAEFFHVNFRHNGRALAGFPDFLRLGLMLVLERRPQEASARQKFMEVRRVTEDRLYGFYTLFFSRLESADVRALAKLTLALADGYFVAQEAENVELEEAFDMMASAILGAAEQLSKGS